MPGVRFGEEVRKLTMFSGQYDFAVTLLLLEDRDRYIALDPEEEPDTYDRFTGRGRDVNNLLARSFPNPGDEAKIIAMFDASAEGRLGIPMRRKGERLRYAYPVVILNARR